MDISQDTAAIRKLLVESKRVAVVGCSPDPSRDSHMIAAYLLQVGYEMIPVHPQATEILGKKCYPNVESIPGTVDIVDIFRRPDGVPPIVEDAIKAKAKSVWMQLGVRNDDAIRRAVEAGLIVVADSCIKVAHAVLKVSRV